MKTEQKYSMYLFGWFFILNQEHDFTNVYFCCDHYTMNMFANSNCIYQMVVAEIQHKGTVWDDYIGCVGEISYKKSNAKLQQVCGLVMDIGDGVSNHR